MLRFTDSFDHYATADFAMKWTNIFYITAGDVLIDDGSGRRATGCLKIQNRYSTGDLHGGYLTKLLDNQSTWIVGFAFDIDALPYCELPILQLLDGTTVQVAAKLQTDGTIKVYRGTSTLLGTTSSAITVGSYVYVEFKIYVHTSTGTVDVRFNEDSVLSLSGQNTDASTNSTANTVRLGTDSTSTDPITTYWYIDDFYACDGQGSANNDFLGDIRVDAYFPAGNGNSNQFVGSDSDSTDNYLLVNESSQNGDTDYVQSSTAEQKDLYAWTDMSHTPSSIFGVQICMAAKKDDAGTRAIAGLARSSSANYSGTSQGLSTSYAYFMDIREQDPATSAAWTKSGFNAAEFGIMVSA